MSQASGHCLIGCAVHPKANMKNRPSQSWIHIRLSFPSLPTPPQEGRANRILSAMKQHECPGPDFLNKCVLGKAKAWGSPAFFLRTPRKKKRKPEGDISNKLGTFRLVFMVNLKIIRCTSRTSSGYGQKKSR